MKTAAKSPTESDVERLRSLFASGALMHPYLSREHFVCIQSPRTAAAPSPSCHGDELPLDEVRDSFVDLAASLSMCCGASPPLWHKNGDSGDEDSFPGKSGWRRSVEKEVRRRRLRLASEIGDGERAEDCESDGIVYKRRHIILILCDGMGNSILENALGGSPMPGSEKLEDSFFLKHNRPARLRAVFPSTTPAALTTLATAAWPGRHGMPGWNLRDKRGCDFPGEPRDGAFPPVQLLVLSDRIRDARSGRPASHLGFESWDEVFVEEPWARRVSSRAERIGTTEQERVGCRREKGLRRMIYVNAYNGDDYQNWSQGQGSSNDARGERRGDDAASDFSSWFIGGKGSKDGVEDAGNRFTLFDTAKIEETAYDTLGRPKGSADAVIFFRDGIDVALRKIAEAERSGESTFVYLYTAHPDKHMHALGTEHEEVKCVVRGLEREVERFWRVLGNKGALLSGKHDLGECDDSAVAKLRSDDLDPVDASVIVTADHGHITVAEDDMVELPNNILALLEYACIGVHGKGRHAYLHCRAGLRTRLWERWRTNTTLSDFFLLITVEDAIENGLFGPAGVRLEVRPRLGDFVAISIGRKTLVTPSETDKFKRCCRCQGAHGSLLPQEMSIPFLLLTPDRG